MQKRYVIVMGQVYDWEEKAPFVPSGESVLGAIEYDRAEDRLKCHECGEWYSALARHVSPRHEISNKEYKQKHGLNLGSRLTSPGMRRKLSEHYRMRFMEGRQGGFGISSTAAKASVASSVARVAARLSGRPFTSKSGPQHEQRNAIGKCAFQLAAKVKQIAMEIGRTPSARELTARGIRGQNLLGANDISALQIMAGCKPNKFRDGHPSPYTRPVLIELLRDFYVLNGRLPTRRDFGLGSLPSQHTYYRAFSSLANAFMEAGLSNIITSTQGKELKSFSTSNCQGCGVEFQAWGNSHRRKLCCSPECASVVRVRAMRASKDLRPRTA